MMPMLLSFLLPKMFRGPQGGTALFLGMQSLSCPVSITETLRKIYERNMKHTSAYTISF